MIEGLSVLIEHRRVTHPDTVDLLQCPYCDKVGLLTKDDLCKHLGEHSKDKPSCQLCGKTFFNNNKLRRHITEVHEGRKNHMCKECGKCFARPDKLRDHEKVHTNPAGTKASKKKVIVKEELIDEDSDYNDENEKEEELLMESDYDDEKHADEDEEAFKRRTDTNQRALDAANLVDVENGQAWHQRASFTCYQCQTSVTSVESVSQHMSSFHASKPEQASCILCPKELPNMTALTIHLWRHFQRALSIPNTQKWLETQFWQCRTCHQDVQGLKAFWDHYELEHGITDPLCPGCDKTDFPDKSTLRRHVKTYHGVKLPCEFCGKFFNEGNKMRRHVIEVHEGRKNHTCNECGKSFARLEKLRQHQNLHQENVNRPFLCHQCGRGFGRQEHVTRHQKICGKKVNQGIG